MKYTLKILLGLIFIAAINIAANARPTPAGNFTVANGQAYINSKALQLPHRSDGSEPVVSEEWLRLDGTPEISLLSYWDRQDGAPSRTVTFLVLDFRTGAVIVSNSVNSGLDFEWGDNNYSIFRGGSLYFGIYSPKKMQFSYSDGKLQINSGKWMGPAQAEKYIEPDKSLPCANVADVPACLAEVEENEAASKPSKRPLNKRTPAASAAARQNN